MATSTFILIPGAGGDAWYWHLLAPRLVALGHEAVPVELPAGDERAGLCEYADAVLAAAAAATTDRLVLVAQSLGGFTAPMVCERLPIRALVFVNAMIPVPGERPGEWFAATSQAEAKRAQNIRCGRAADAPFDPLLDFFHDVPQPVTEEAWLRGAPTQANGVFSSPCVFGAWPSVPMHVVVGSGDRLFPAPFQERVAQNRLGIAPDELPAGHLIALSQPDALAMQLDCYARRA